MTDILVDRHEEKYLLDPLAAVRLKSLLDGLLQRDSYSRQGAYLIRSVYFDTQDDVDYANKVLGVSDRHKLRLRVYDTAAQTVKLEIKNKRGTLSSKQTALLPRGAAERLLQGRHEVLLDIPSDTARRAFTFFQKEQRVPAALVDYERLAYLCPASRTRITLDSGVRAAKSNRLFSDSVPVAGLYGGGIVILEVKYDSFLPGYLRQVLSGFDIQKLSVSKYELARRFLY